jgi:pectate lyase
LLVATAATLVAGMVGIAGYASAASAFSDNFEDGDSAGWSASGGSWSVGVDGSQVLRQTGTSSDARARAGQSTWTDYTVTARVKPTAFNGANRFVAVLARAQSATSYYYLALRSNNTVELKKLVNGASTTLATAPVTVAPGTWYTVSLQAAGSSLKGSVAGGPVLTATDTQFTAGQIGVATYYASANFDDVAVDSTSGGGPSPTSSATASPTGSSSATASPTPSRTPTASPTISANPQPNQADGFAGVNALGLNGTSGGAGGRTVTAANAAEFLSYIDSKETLIIRVTGRIEITSKQGVRPNKTIVGAGPGAIINGGGLDFYKSYNVIVRNLTFTNADDDAINVGQNSHHIWIDHNTISGALDGSVDIVRGSEYVTVSWNHFDHADKTMLIGHSDSNASEDTGHLKVSIHHNFFDHSRQRHPRVRFGEPVHVYNNYFLGNDIYGVASTMNAGVLVEGNYFGGVAHPIYSTSGYADSGPGRAVERNNIYSESGTPEVNGTVLEPRTFYGYTLDSPATIPSIVPAGAGVGRINP